MLGLSAAARFVTNSQYEDIWSDIGIARMYVIILTMGFWLTFAVLE